MNSIDLNPSFIRKVLFIWIAPIISYYKNSKPSPSNLLQVSHNEEYERSTKILKENFDYQCQNGTPNFTKAFVQTFSKELFWLWALSTISNLFMVLECVLIYYIIKYIDDSGRSDTEGALLALAFVSQAILCVILNSNSSISNALFTVKIRRVFANLILEKCLKMHGSQINSKSTSAKCLNLIASDMLNQEGFSLIIMFFMIVFTFLAFFITTAVYFGGWGVIGIAISFFHIPLILAIGSRNKAIISTVNNISDTRVTMIQNLIEGIQILKLNAWEIPYLQRIYDEKEKEALLKKRIGNINNIFRVFAFAGLGLIIFTSLTLSVKAGNDLEASEVFFLISIVLFSQVVSVIGIVIGVIAIFEVLAAFKRLEEVLLAEEFHQITSNPKEISLLLLSNAEFSWNIEAPLTDHLTESQNNPQEGNISNISFAIEKNGLIMVAGPSGCGKTTLLLGLLHEIYLRSGECAVNGNISYAAEFPWLLPESVKKNITLGKELDEARYMQVLRSCDLLKDLEMLPEGDQSVIGDRGVTLSGGQKSRIGLARALYSDSDIYLLDDPLSAVDTEVGNHLFSSIKELSRTKIVVLVTHQIHFLVQADIVIVLEQGKQVFCGAPEEMEKIEEVQNLLGSMGLNYTKKIEVFKEEIMKKTEANLIATNDEHEITVNFQTYLKYLVLGFKTKLNICIVIVLMIPSQFAMIFMMFWCNLWLESNESDSSYYITGLGIIVLALYLTFALRSYPFFNFSIDCNKNLHNNALEGLAKTHSVYFDLNTTGSLINRFSKDTATIDGLLTMSFYESISLTISSIAMTITISIILPYVIISLPIHILLFYYFFSYFQILVVQLKSIEISSRGPFLSSLNSVFAGYSTIRALNLIPHFRKQMEERSLNNYRADYAYQVVLYFTQFYYQISMLVLLITNVIAIIATKGTLDAPLVGISLALASLYIKASRSHNRFVIDLHSMMCSTQRLLAFAELESEGAYSLNPDFSVTKGRIRFVNICMRYRPECKLALNNLNLFVEAGSKLGIVGRTGAGKSSIVQVLFRLVNPESGVVLIDNINYMSIGLHDLRRQLSVIPQNSFLFNASLRDNLDPFHEHTDQELYEVLEEVQLKFLVEDQTCLHNSVVGQDLCMSAGQKQLLCVARAVLRKNRIVVMDEATSNIDNQTDKIMNDVIRDKFSGCTLIVIAHRLRTIINSEKIAVIENGECKETGTPLDLFDDKESLFRNLVLNTGAEETEYLINLLRD